MKREGAGRWLISLAWVDAVALGLWLWMLNRLVFHHPLDWRDYLGVPGLALAAAAATGRYARRPVLFGRALAATLAGQALFAGAVCLGGAVRALHLSPREGLKLAALQLPLLALVQIGDRRCRRVRPEAPGETTRLVLIVAAGLALAEVFVTDGRVGTGDAYWYQNMLADFVTQWRAGVFPVFIGQSELAFNGAVNPLRFAPYFQHCGGVLDLLTLHALGFNALQNLTLVLAMVGGGISAYLCGAAILPGRRWIALGVALLYLACPAVLALLYTGNLFMSVTTLPYLPLAAYGLWRWCEKSAGDRTVLSRAAWLALPLAALWWCHPPIALWTTAVVLLGAAGALAGSWRSRRAWLAAGAAAGLFVLAAGYVFVSVLTLALPPTAPVNPASFLGSVEGAFPASILPVSATADRISDYQLGWSLWILAGFALAAWARRPRRGLGAAAGAIVVLTLFLLPVPGIDRWLWRHAVPQVASDITFAWAAQRLCVVLAAFATIAGLAAFSTAPPRSVLRRLALAMLFCAALVWDGKEDVKFLRRGAAMTVPAAVALRTEGEHNAFLTRYAFNILLPVPAYFSHGYVDPYLENRLLAADGRTVLVSNLASVRPGDGAPSFALTDTYNATYHYADISPTFALAPGVRYAARLALHLPAAPGTFQAEGAYTERQYFLPDPAYGMIHQVPTHSFGFGPTSSDFFPLSTGSAHGDTIKLLYAFNDPAPAALPADFGRLYLRPYAVEQLPVAVSSWIPYRARASVAVAGAWLETPRLYVPGYAATVNGHPARLLRSPDGLVAVALQPGENQVTLCYPGPWLLRAAYAVSLLTWMVMLARWAAAAAARSRSPSPPSPAR